MSARPQWLPRTGFACKPAEPEPELFSANFPAPVAEDMPPIKCKAACRECADGLECPTAAQRAYDDWHIGWPFTPMRLVGAIVLVCLAIYCSSVFPLGFAR